MKTTVDPMPSISRNLFQAVCDAMPDVLYTLDCDGRFSYVSPGIQEYGYEQVELIGRHFTDILDPEDALLHSAKFVLQEYRGNPPLEPPALFDERRTGSRRTKNLIVRIPAGDGTGRIFHGEVFASGFYVKDGAGQPTRAGTVGTIRNATERIAAEKRTRKMSRAVEQAPAMIVITDPKGIVEYVNPAFTAITGFLPEEVLGKNPPCFQINDDSRQDEMIRAVFRGQDWKGEIFSRKKDGEGFWEALSISHLCDDHGKVTNLVLISEDRTESRLLTPYFSKDVVKKILEGGLNNPLVGENTVATILFFDIRNFTSISETLDPVLVADFLNRIFTDVMDLVFSHGGSVNKMIGDAILATFGCPSGTGHDAENAADCALAIRDTITFFNHVKPEYLEQDVRIGIGIATGRVFAGNVGSYRRMEYTVIGDVVNTASRLQSLTREMGCDILMDQPTRDAISGKYDLTERESAALRGRSAETVIYSLDGMSHEGTGTILFRTASEISPSTVVDRTVLKDAGDEEQ